LVSVKLAYFSEVMGLLKVRWVPKR